MERGLRRVAAATAVAALAAFPAAAAKNESAEEEKEEKGLPLEASRTIEFTTSEVTWLSLDVHPDGGTIVLEALGDLYTLPIAGGEAARITDGLAFDSQPRYSPDGARIAFLSDRDGAENVWIAGADGSEPKQLSKDKNAEFASPAWSADGDWVIASRTAPGLGTFELWMYHLQGGSGIQLTKAKPTPDTPRAARPNALGVVAAPDGRTLYWAAKSGGFQYNLTFPQWQVARHDLETGMTDVLTRAPGSAIRPLLSPDGELLVYGTRHDGATGLRVRELASGADRWLIYPIQRDDQESRATRDLLPNYAFVPDGSAIVLGMDGGIRRIELADGAVSEIPFTLGIAQRIGPLLEAEQRVDEGPVAVRILQDPTPSPDGATLAFSALTRIWTRALPEGTPTPLTAADTPAFQPTWSPDGRWLAWVTWTDGGGHVWKGPADGASEPVRLTSAPAFYADPVWAPDGERIVALRASAFERSLTEFDFGVTGMDVVWLSTDPAAGGEVHLVVPSRGVGKPHFGPDPDRIYAYLAAGSGEAPHGLVSFRFDGTDRRTHLKVTGPGLYFAGEPVPANDVRVSPDGKWALVHVANQLYVTTFPRVGETPTVNVDSPAVPIRKLTTIGADYFGWADGGDTMTWAVGASFFRQALDSVSFEDEAGDDGEKEGETSKRRKRRQQQEEPEPEPPQYEEIEIELAVPRDRPEGVLVLRGGRVITMRGEEVIEDADVVIDGHRIAAVGARGEVEVPDGAHIEVVDGATITPGFIDTHAHWFEIRRGVLDTQNWSFLANLAYGVTAGLDVQTATNDMFAYQDLVDSGRILGPRAYSTGPGIFSDNAFASAEAAEGVLRRYRDYYRTRNLKAYLAGNRQQRQWIAQAARKLGMMPTTEGALDLKLDLTHVLDGFAGNEHSFPIVPLYRDVVELVARSQSAYTPTLLVAYGAPWAENYFYATEEVHDDAKLRRFVPHALIDAKSQRVPWFRRQEHAFDALAAGAAAIQRAGGRVGVGSHGQLQGLGYHWELWALASGGLTAHEALHAATLGGAEVIGFARDLGSIEPGKMADLLVFDANPLDDLRNTLSIRKVMKNGELFDADTLDQLWPEERALAPLWWWDDEPPLRAVAGAE